MVDFLNRNEAPLTPEQWSRLDNLVVQAASKRLVGRRLINVVGPVGAGMLAVPNYVYMAEGPAVVDTMGPFDESPVIPVDRVFQTMPVIYKDFILFWRDIEMSQRLGFPLELGAAGACAAFVADREDELIFNGLEEMDYPGLLNMPDRTSMDMADWGEAGAIFSDAVGAMTRLVQAGFFGPFAMVVSPANFAQMSRLYGNSGRLELEQIRQVMTAGVFFTPAVPDGAAVVVSTGPQNLDLVIGQDLTVAYLTQDGLDHPFRVMESLVLRVHRPGAICTIGGAMGAGQAEAGESQGGEGKRGSRRRQQQGS